MQYYLKRGNRQFGPYTPQRLGELVKLGQVLVQDEVVPDDTNAPSFLTMQNTSVGEILRLNAIPVRVDSAGNFFQQVKALGNKLWFSSDIFRWSNIKDDKRLLMLGMVGLAPLAMLYVLQVLNTEIVTFYAVALYFSAIWGLFYYYMFKTKQVDLKLTAKMFFAVQAIILVVYGVGLNQLNIFYSLVDRGGILASGLGYVLGVGVTEELIKALPLVYIARKSKTPLVPQTMVFYGVMCGLSFGVFEGVEYQITANKSLDYDSSFLMNIARVTSLPFFHSMCTGLAGFFISFAVLKPRYRQYLYFLAIAMPAVVHGLYDTFCSSIIGFFFGYVIVLLLNYYLNNDKKIQEILRD